MNKILLIGTALVMITTGLSACGIPKEDFDAVVTERDEALDAKEKAEVKIASLEEQYDTVLAERDKAIVAKNEAEVKAGALEDQKATLEIDLAGAINQIPPPGRIILKKVIVSGDRETQTDYWINFGRYFNHDEQFSMKDGDEVDSGFVLSPGTYQIRKAENHPWLDPVIIIEDPGRDSFSQYMSASINVAPGETVLVTYYESVWFSSGSLSIDQYNETHYFTSYGGSSETFSQSFTPSVGNLNAVELLLRPGGLFPIRGMSSIVEVRDGGPDGQILGTATSFILPPENLGKILWARFIFETPISLNPGKQYYISWFMPGAPYLTWIGSDNDPYQAGVAYNSRGDPMENTDFCFRTLH